MSGELCAPSALAVWGIVVGYLGTIGYLFIIIHLAKAVASILATPAD